MDDRLYHHGIKGMKWGVRRYQNPDGSLTPEGMKRREKEISGMSKKKAADYVANPNKWVEEDIGGTRNLNEATRQLSQNLKIFNNVPQKIPSKRMNLEGMTDQELRNKINRELLERQYSDMFGEPTISKGRQKADEILKYTTDVLAVTGSSLALALAIKQLKG